MKYEFHPEAFFEFEAAADFYAERQKGLEFRFLDAVQSAKYIAPVKHRKDGGFSMEIFGEFLSMYFHMQFSTR